MTQGHVLLLNPRITSRRSARFPLAVLHLAAALMPARRATIIDGNVDDDAAGSLRAALAFGGIEAVGITVMGGPQLPAALALSRVVRAASPATPIVWGGYFPTLCPGATLNSDCVDFVVRGQGEATLPAVLDVLASGRREALAGVAGLSWRRGAETVHNEERAFSASPPAQALPYELLGSPAQYLQRTYLGARTTGHQAALGCRYRCNFCGVAAMFRGRTALPPAERLDHELQQMKSRFGVDSLQFYDHNFFDREADMLPLLEVLARHALPWWCFARADALADLSDRGWALVRKSRLRMAYIGAESPSDQVLHDMRKGTRADQTLEVVERCRANGVIPELSFMLASPHDPEGETERSFEFIRRIKRLHPATEIMLYVHTPLPPGHRDTGATSQRPLTLLRDADGRPLRYPDSADGWADPAWLRYWCHQDAPWLSPRLRQRIADFGTVLASRYPTVSDIRTPPWQKSALSALAAWRYGSRRYDSPWELDLSRRVVRLWDPRVSSL